MNFEATSEFTKDFERLSKKYPSLPQDMELFKLILTDSPLGAGKNFTVLQQIKDIRIVKARLRCRSLRKSSLRIVYAYQSSKVFFVFVDLYAKADREREDWGRIREALAIIT